MTLNQLKTGASAIIRTVGGQGAAPPPAGHGVDAPHRHQGDQGGPHGDPIACRLRGYELTPAAGGRPENRDRRGGLMSITFALLGNQTAARPPLFNQLTGSNQHVGNFPG